MLPPCLRPTSLHRQPVNENSFAFEAPRPPCQGVNVNRVWREDHARPIRSSGFAWTLIRFGRSGIARETMILATAKIRSPRSLRQPRGHEQKRTQTEVGRRPSSSTNSPCEKRATGKKHDAAGPKPDQETDLLKCPDQSIPIARTVRRVRARVYFTLIRIQSFDNENVETLDHSTGRSLSSIP